MSKEFWRDSVLTICSVNAVAPGPVDTVQFRREIKENPLQLWLDAQATLVKLENETIELT